VGGRKKFQKIKIKLGAGGEKINFPQKKKNKGKKTGWGAKRNKVAKKKTKIRVGKGQTKKINLGWHKDRKENPVNAPSIHVGELVGLGSF